MSEYKINIVHLYPDLLNLYGDKGNIECLRHRLSWRGIDVQVRECTVDAPEFDFAETDIVFLGGGSEREQEIVCQKLVEHKKEFMDYVENDGVLIAACGGFEIIGKSYGTSDNKKEALGILDFVTEYPNDNSRLIGNVVIECEGIDGYVVGFENHAGKINIGKYKPMGIIKKGYGNDGKGTADGVVYKNVFATSHGPLLPKNPKLCDFILEKALKKKYSDFNGLGTLDDSLENKANEYMVKVLL